MNSESPKTCPTDSVLALFLHGEPLSESQSPWTRELVEQHVNECEVCQHSLERLVAGQESWEGTAKQLAELEAHRQSSVVETPALKELIDKARQQTVEFDGAPSGLADEAGFSAAMLGILQPSDQPDSRGRLGSYEILDVVGQGGMGIVFKAYDPSLRRIVAIKVMAGHLASSPLAKQRFVREARAAAAVIHDHVVGIYAVDEEHQPPFLVMQFISGRTLQQRLLDSGPLALNEILRIGMQTASGLAAAHAQGLVHRDIKPANILLENGVERVKITDFGLARGVGDVDLTQTGFVAGTPQFMAPEQANGDAIDMRSDLFSLGSVLYMMCTGQAPFRATTAMGVLKRICEETPRPIRELNPAIPDWLEAIIGKLLSKRADDRFQSAREVAELLGRWLSHVQSPTTVARPVPVEATNRESQTTNSPLLDGRARSRSQDAAVLAREQHGFSDVSEVADPITPKVTPSHSEPGATPAKRIGIPPRSAGILLLSIPLIVVLASLLFPYVYNASPLFGWGMMAGVTATVTVFCYWIIKSLFKPANLRRLQELRLEFRRKATRWHLVMLVCWMLFVIPMADSSVTAPVDRGWMHVLALIVVAAGILVPTAIITRAWMQKRQSGSWEKTILRGPPWSLLPQCAIFFGIVVNWGWTVGTSGIVEFDIDDPRFSVGLNGPGVNSNYSVSFRALRLRSGQYHWTVSHGGDAITSGEFNLPTGGKAVIRARSPYAVGRADIECLPGRWELQLWGQGFPQGRGDSHERQVAEYVDVTSAEIRIHSSRFQREIARKLGLSTVQTPVYSFVASPPEQPDEYHNRIELYVVDETTRVKTPVANGLFSADRKRLTLLLRPASYPRPTSWWKSPEGDPRDYVFYLNKATDRILLQGSWVDAHEQGTAKTPENIATFRRLDELLKSGDRNSSEAIRLWRRLPASHSQLCDHPELSFNGDGFVAQWFSPDPLLGQFRIDEQQTPKRITLTGGVKKGVTRVIDGIYELDGDNLRLRLNLDGTIPGSFEPPTGKAEAQQGEDPNQSADETSIELLLKRKP